MASITIRRLEDSVKSKLRLRAALNGRSMEDEAREILKAGVTAQPDGLNLAESIRRRIAPVGGIDLTLPLRQAVRRNSADDHS